MPEDINNLDPNDDGLKGIFGDRFTDATAQTPEKPKATRKPSNTTQPEKAAQKPAQKPTKESEDFKDAKWQPVKPDPNYLDKLKTTAKDVSMYAVLSTILFWWQQSGKLEETTAWYALLVCVGMVFFTVGKNWRWGER